MSTIEDLLPTVTLPVLDGAKCVSYPKEWWFAHGNSAETHAALAICRDCPAQRDCLEFALQEGSACGGTWGATTEYQRRRLLSQRAAEHEEEAEPNRCAACPRTATVLECGYCATCYQRWHRAGQPSEGPPPARPTRRESIARAAALQGQGHSVEAVARLMGVRPQAVRGYLREAEAVAA